ncbi:cytochrome P450 2C31-like isoform X2 [Ruditapes philippinarum]|uniref:cytochrome P450 2C31-like isoform X2 n=1 Tax=Ruditapes philippinarum TaxID=129788 RepID=UPI00295B88DA|nr:cytochrome P450 2C31-like isoform X2 [Ruditapes philippinarum]
MFATVKLMSNRIIVINSERLFRLATTGEEYKLYLNDRPASFYGETFLNGSQWASLHTNGSIKEHAPYRKMFARFIRDAKAEERPLFLDKISCKKGVDFEIVSELKSSLATTICSILIGNDFNERDPKLVAEFMDITDYLLPSSDVNDAVQAYPCLRIFTPTYNVKFQRASAIKYAIMNVYVKQQKEKIVPGVVRGIVDQSLQEQMEDIKAGREPLLTDDKIFYQVLEVMEAGLVAWWTFLSNALLCLLNHPEYQDKMFEELERVVGHKRDVKLSDKSQCPFTEAVELEVHRYLPVVPFLDARFCGVDLNFEGYDLPKDSIILGNIWFIHHNETIFEDPWKFRPERWLEEDGKLINKNHVYRKNLIPFGSGSRKCLGSHLSSSILFMHLSSIFRRWKCVSPPGGTMSCDPRDQTNFENKVTLRPKPFYGRFEERF